MRRRVRSSPRSYRCLPWQAQRGVGALLLLTCLPALLVNVGTGRSVWIHHHADESLHTHLVAEFRQHHRVHWHGDDHEHGGAGHGQPVAHDAFTRPAEHENHRDGTVLRGTEVAVSKKHESATELGVLQPGLSGPISFTMLRRLVVRPDRPHDPAAAPRQTELACLRAVVLLT